ncbi:hypothetical protein [Komagataeibacter kakiaceti]|uniref:hypothetical protein n=1 Tax=Komagataeibacter kakiaceti TaxID=943261 RepID=UPI0011DD7438|nr:hypothetical protein [Komagataeibacter kakiaceti]
MRPFTDYALRQGRENRDSARIEIKNSFILLECSEAGPDAAHARFPTDPVLYQGMAVAFGGRIGPVREPFRPCIKQSCASEFLNLFNKK